MVWSSRQTIACILLIFGTAFYLRAQTSPAKPPSASISGKVTIKGKDAPGITIVALAVNNSGRDRGRYRATTDSSGKYRIGNLPEGNYQIHPYVLAFAVENQRANLIVAEGETVEDINFALVPGGVITGKITDSEGRPLIEEPVNVSYVDGQNENLRFHRGWILTDDRGIYRAFGLRAGQYKVSAGLSAYRLYGKRQSYKHTYHPSTTDAAKATIIEVSEGSETKNIDIVLAIGATSGFKVAGRIIDGESGKPLSNIVYGLTQRYEGGNTTSMNGPASNADGEFKFENVSPGKYSVYIQPPPNSEMRANPVSFEVTDRDITGLTIKTTKGASLSGIVVLEGPDEKPLISKRGEFYIQAFVQSSEPDDHHEDPMPTLNPDGTFKISGLRGGTAQLFVTSMNRPESEFAIIRVERNGVAQSNNTINLKEGEQVDGVRVIVNKFTGSIRGEVKIEDGELPPSAGMSVFAMFLDDSVSTRPHSGQPDSRGRFYVDGLKAGRYEVQVSVFLPGPQPRQLQSKKEVTVADNTVTEVILTLKLNP